MITKAEMKLIEAIGAFLETDLFGDPCIVFILTDGRKVTVTAVGGGELSLESTDVI